MDTRMDNNNYGRQSSESERDLAAKGGPTTGLGNPDAKHSGAAPYDADLQTQIAARGSKNKKSGKTNVGNQPEQEE
ncbi:MAG TPA: hypothetical protein VL307_06960 [Chitinophagaceae bacterium]|nr:hypothetical protein [Chitinophagaceae bacterium]